jgi:hypothetical protein
MNDNFMALYIFPQGISEAVSLGEHHPGP